MKLVTPLQKMEQKKNGGGCHRVYVHQLLSSSQGVTGYTQHLIQVIMNPTKYIYSLRAKPDRRRIRSLAVYAKWCEHRQIGQRSSQVCHSSFPSNIYIVVLRLDGHIRTYSLQRQESLSRVIIQICQPNQFAVSFAVLISTRTWSHVVESTLHIFNLNYTLRYMGTLMSGPPPST